jgi:hypothetical protein
LQLPFVLTVAAKLGFSVVSSAAIDGTTTRTISEAQKRVNDVTMAATNNEIFFTA